MMTDTQNKSLPETILARIDGAKGKVWTPTDFADLGNREAVDKALKRMAKNNQIRRIERGLYDRPEISKLTGKKTVPDYRAVIDAVTRRDHVRWLIDGMTAANTLGLTNAVPAKIEVLVDARLKPIELGQQKIIFKQAVPSRLYWDGRPGMYLVQALYWLHDVLSNREEKDKITSTVKRLLSDGKSGPKLIDDLKSGFSAMPIWMQETLRGPLRDAESQSDL